MDNRIWAIEGVSGEYDTIWNEVVSVWWSEDEASAELDHLIKIQGRPNKDNVDTWTDYSITFYEVGKSSIEETE